MLLPQTLVPVEGSTPIMLPTQVQLMPTQVLPIPKQLRPNSKSNLKTSNLKTYEVCLSVCMCLCVCLSYPEWDNYKPKDWQTDKHTQYPISIGWLYRLNGFCFCITGDCALHDCQYVTCNSTRNAGYVFVYSANLVTLIIK